MRDRERVPGTRVKRVRAYNARTIMQLYGVVETRYTKGASLQLT